MLTLYFTVNKGQ